jgi:hypothetical protein
MALSSLAALLFVYLFMPALWLSIMSVDESLDAHEAGLALVASRTSCSLCRIGPILQTLQGNPFRETGPPANMAKLILLRHKVRAIRFATPTPTQLLTHPSRFKRATGSDVAPHIHDKHHEHTLFPRLAQKHPGCVSGNHLGENSITDAVITRSTPVHSRLLVIVVLLLTIPNIRTYGSVTPLSLALSSLHFRPSKPNSLRFQDYKTLSNDMYYITFQEGKERVKWINSREMATLVCDNR